MSVKDLKRIDVYNYNNYVVTISISPYEGMAVRGVDEDGNPGVVMLTLDEIRYVNNSAAFKGGLLEFSKEYEDELYEILGIKKDSVLKLSEITDILLHPTKDGLKRIVGIKSYAEFVRVKDEFGILKRKGYPLTLDVDNLIKQRLKELFRNQSKSNIVIGDINDNALNENKKISELQKKIEELELLIMASTNNNDVVSESISNDKLIEEETSIEDKPKKRGGRPKKTTTV